MTETLPLPTSSMDIDARLTCLKEAELLYPLEAYLDAAIELITAANNGKYDFKKSIIENFNMACLSTHREICSQDLHRQMSPAF